MVQRYFETNGWVAITSAFRQMEIICRKLTVDGCHTSSSSILASLFLDVPLVTRRNWVVRPSCGLCYMHFHEEWIWHSFWALINYYLKKSIEELCEFGVNTRTPPKILKRYMFEHAFTVESPELCLALIFHQPNS